MLEKIVKNLLKCGDSALRNVFLFAGAVLALSGGGAQGDARKISASDAIVLAVSRNSSLKATSEQIGRALADEKSAKSKRSVQISANAFVTSSNMGGIAQSSADVSPGALVDAQSRGVADQNISAMIPIYTGGRIEAGIDSAKRQSSAAKDRYDASVIDLRADAAGAYVDCALSFELVKSAQARVDFEERQVRDVRERVPNGKAAPVDELSEEAALADSQKDLAEAQGDSLRNLAVLKSLLFLRQEDDLELADTLDSLSNRWMAHSGDLPELIALATANRPEIAEAKANVEASNDIVRLAKGIYSPQVAGFAMASASDRTGSPMGGTSEGYMLGVSASLSIADGGRKKADLDNAKSKADEANDNLEAAKNKAASDAAIAYVAIAPAKEAVVSAQASADYARKAYELADLRYSTGKAILAERLGASAALARSEAELLEAKANLIKADIELLRATGSEAH